MKRGTLFCLVLLGFAVISIQSTRAGSAVAWDGHGHLGASAGYPLQEAKQRALKRCRRNGGVNPRILEATEVVGDGAIAVARGAAGGSVIGVTLGCPSPVDAENRAMQKCLKAGGVNPKIICGFRG
jgi:Domain of unknown function (DUF4189)